MKQLQLSDADAWDYTQALGRLATARYQLNQTTRHILAAHEVPPTAQFTIDGNVLTVHSEAPDA